MPHSANSPDGLTRVAIIAGTRRYKFAAEWEELPKVRAALIDFASALRERDYVPVGKPRYLLNPNKQGLIKRLLSVPTDADIVIACYTGHGHFDELHYLITKDSTQQAPEYLVNSAIETRLLPKLLSKRDQTGRKLDPQPHLLIIVDTCYAGAAAEDITKDAIGEVVDPGHTWVIASSRKADYAQQGLFAAVFRQALSESTAPPGQRYVPLETLMDRVKELLPKTQQARFHPPSGGSDGIPPFFPNPCYEPAPTGQTLAGQDRWRSRTRGTDARSTAGYYLAGTEGRVTAARDIARWISDPDGGATAIVTGKQGSGKSTLLALPLLLSSPVYRDNLLAATRGRPIVNAVTQTLGVDAGLIAVHGRGLNVDQIAGVIGSGVGRHVETAGELLKTLDREPLAQSHVVVLDALDDVERPEDVIDALVSELPARHGMRVLVGARNPMAMTIPDPSLVVNLDAEPYLDRQALTSYVQDLLIAAEEPGVTTPYQLLAGDQRALIAGAIGASAKGSFLAGQLAALALRRRGQAIDTRPRSWRQEIPTSLDTAFDAGLTRLGERSGRARALLTALAWAKGPGLPWEYLWVAVANAIRPVLSEPPLEALTDQDIDWLRESAGAYIVEDVAPDGRAVFRLSSEPFAAHLRDPDESSLTRAASAAHARTVNGLVAEALLASVPRDSAGARLWQLAQPYVRRYLAAHAADAGNDALVRLLADQPDYLVATHPPTLLALLSQREHPQGPSPEAVYQRAAARLGSDLCWNAAYLQEAAVALKAQYLVNVFSAGQFEPAFTTVIADQQPEGAPSLEQAPDAHEPDCPAASSLAVAPLPDGRRVLASAGPSGGVRLWDPASRQAIRDIRSDDAPLVSALTALRLPDGRCLLASGSVTGEVRIVDAQSGSPIGSPLRGQGGAVIALAAVPTARGPALASAGEGGQVDIWCAEEDQRAPGGRAEWPRYSHLAVLELAGARAQTLAVAQLPDGQSLLAAGCSDGTIRVWDQSWSMSLQAQRARSGPVRALAAVTTPTGRHVIASGADDGAIQLWDLQRKRPAPTTLKGHGGPVRALAPLLSPDGRQLLASGGTDGSVRLWDLADGAQLSEIRQPTAVTAIVGWTNSLLAIGSIEGLTVIVPPQMWGPGPPTP